MTQSATGAWKRQAAVATAAVANPAHKQGSVTATASVDTYQMRADSRGFDIQIGAYQSRNEAVDKLSTAQQAAGTILKGHSPYIMVFEKDGTNYHRARFAGFASKEGANSACANLKQLHSFNCIVMAP